MCDRERPGPSENQAKKIVDKSRLLAVKCLTDRKKVWAALSLPIIPRILRLTVSQGSLPNEVSFI